MNTPNRYYILKEDGEPAAEPSLNAWALWMEDFPKIVIAKTVLIGDRGKTVMVSTVFLGLDHNYEPSGQPILFETMVFDGTLDGNQDRCGGNRAEAELMHKKMVASVIESNPSLKLQTP